MHEKQRVLLTETNGNANIDWDCRSLYDVKLLLEYGLDYIKKLEKQGEQKPTWGEEDEKMLDGIIEASIHHCYLNITDINWLKSIKDRVQPKQEWSEKPSDKQLRQLELAIDYWQPNNTEVTTTLFKLWEDLKKLKAGKL